MPKRWIKDPFLHTIFVTYKSKYLNAIDETRRVLNKLPFQCDFDPAEDNYEDFCNLESTRQALHVGSLEFPNSGDVYFSMINVFMDDGREDVEFCLENYRTLIYNGNFDIICDHTGIMDMILDLNWSGLENYKYLRWDTTQI